MFIFLILLLLLVILVSWYLIKNFKNPRIDTINIISGCVGGGKTSSVVCRVRRQLFRYYFLGRNKSIKKDYIILSNFPIGNKYDKKKQARYMRILFTKIYCYDLDLSYLLLQERPQQDEVIYVIDEFSSIANQFDYKNPNIQYNIDEFTRCLRHYTHGMGYLYGIDQCSQNIFYQVRRRSSYCYNMIHSHKLKFLPITIFQYRKILLSDEVDNVVDVDKVTEESEYKRFIFFCNPFKYFDSFCLSDRYNVVPYCNEYKSSKEYKRFDVMKLSSSKPTYYNCLSFDKISLEDLQKLCKVKS